MNNGRNNPALNQRRSHSWEIDICSALDAFPPLFFGIAKEKEAQVVYAPMELEQNISAVLPLEGKKKLEKGLFDRFAAAAEAGVVRNSGYGSARGRPSHGVIYVELSPPH